MKTEIVIPECFGKVAELASLLKVVPLNQIPGCWEQVVDEKWSIKVNGHDSQKRISRYPRG